MCEKIEMNMDRLRCITDHLLTIIDSGAYTRVTISIDDHSCVITPIADPISIVIKRENV
jgi:hypothetical protein